MKVASALGRMQYAPAVVEARSTLRVACQVRLGPKGEASSRALSFTGPRASAEMDAKLRLAPQVAEEAFSDGLLSADELQQTRRELWQTYREQLHHFGVDPASMPDPTTEQPQKVWPYGYFFDRIRQSLKLFPIHRSQQASIMAPVIRRRAF